MMNAKNIKALILLSLICLITINAASTPIDDYSDSCVMVYDQCNYKGKSQKLCGYIANLGK